MYDWEEWVGVSRMTCKDGTKDWHETGMGLGRNGDLEGFPYFVLLVPDAMSMRTGFHT